jgi:hypothetical protein
MTLKMREQIDEALARTEKDVLSRVVGALKACADARGPGPLKRLAADARAKPGASACAKAILAAVSGEEIRP